MEKCSSLFSRQQHSECFTELVGLLQMQMPTPQIEVLSLMSSLLGMHVKYRSLQAALLRIAGNTKPQCQQHLVLALQLVSLLIDMGLLDEARSVLLAAEASDMKPSLKYHVSMVHSMIDQGIACQKVQTELSEQIATFDKLWAEQDQLKYFQHDGLFAYLIPANWLQRWKSYVQYDQVEVPHQDDPLQDVDQSVLTQFKTLLQLNQESIIEEEESMHPGPIDGSRFVQLMDNLIMDPMAPKQYNNYVLKQNLQEGLDYVFVSSKIYQYFVQLYGGFQVKRMIVEHGQTQQIYVDLMPRVYQFIIYPPMNDHHIEIHSLNANCKDTIDQLSKKVSRSFNITHECKWWRFLDPDAFIDWSNMLSKGSLVTTIKAKTIDDKQLVEDTNVADNEILLLEIKQSKNWVFQEEKSSIQKYTNDKSVQQIMNDYDISPVPKMTQDSRRGVTGLQNLGNTCFMNAAMQCMSNTYELTEFMVSNQFIPDLNPKNPLGTRGFLATSYADLMKCMWFGKSQSVSAIDLKRVIGKFAPQFYGYGQQDSHELLSYLLDGLHEDLNRVINKPLVTDIEITNETDQQASQKFWINYTLRNSSKIFDLMGGQYKSTLVCPKCNRVSKTFDPFMSLSLPIPSYQALTQQVYFIYADTEQLALKMTLNLTSDMDGTEILKQLGTITNINPNCINLLLIKDHKIHDRVDRGRNAKWINEHEGILFAQEVSKNYFTLDDTECNISYMYSIKATNVIYTDKIVSFTRELVMNKQQTIADLYIAIYRRFRTHLMIAMKDIPEKDFPLKDDMMRMAKPESLQDLAREIQQLQEMNKLPFTLKVASKIVTYNADTTLDKYGNNIIVEVYLGDYLKGNAGLLKLQRCKEYIAPQEQQKGSKRKGEYTLEDCLRAFTKEEILGKGDEWYCNKCKLHVQASKKMEIYLAPKILIIHLKRFKTNRIHNLGNFYFSGNSQKISSLVNFPVERLDINQFVLSKQSDSDPTDYVYDLYGVDNHFGGLGGGHYTAFAHNSVLRRWVDYNDSSARVTSNEVVSEAAYVLFYRRRDAMPCNLGK